MVGIVGGGARGPFKGIFLVVAVALFFFFFLERSTGKHVNTST